MSRVMRCVKVVECLRVWSSQMPRGREVGWGVVWWPQHVTYIRRRVENQLMSTISKLVVWTIQVCGRGEKVGDQCCGACSSVQ